MFAEKAKGFVVLKRTGGFGGALCDRVPPLLGAGVLGHRLGAFADGVLRQLSWQEQTHGGLDLPAGDGGPLVVVSQARSFGCYSLENVVHERVHDRHGLRGDAGVRMNLLQHFVDVDGVALLPPALLFLVALGDVLLSLAGLFGRFAASLRWHVDIEITCRQSDDE